ncbi:membrane-bound lytic murein transglycosylase D [Candidatus Magnetomorum sp. HK-1]|nr:membrane-bound lytic murein transglycosylase D [Candidatus Magnetomorum sp. HK-1]
MHFKTRFLSVIVVLLFCGCQTAIIPDENQLPPPLFEISESNNPEKKSSQHSMEDNEASPLDDESTMDEYVDSPMELNIQEPFPESQSKRLVNGSSKQSFSEYPKISPAQKALDEALEFCEASQEYWQKGELDQAIDALDQAYQLIVSINTEAPNLFQQKEDLRFMISKRILEIYASRNIVVNGTHEAIPIIINEHVKREIKRFTGVERSFFQASYRRSGQYRPMIIRELKKAGLPLALSWLPLIESGYKVKALSRARALGLWQFIPSTGYKFGLKRTRYIDERMDPYKATLAAIAYLKELHRIFGDWTTVLAAYNCGEGRVLRTIQRQNINYLDNFWDLYDKLPRETARYVPRFLATLHIVNNLKQCGFDPDDLMSPPRVERVEIMRQAHLKNIAAKLKIPANTLYSLNPELRYRILPNEPYALKIPDGKRQLLLATIKRIPSARLPRSATRSGYKYHRIRKGESLSSIAKKYRVRVKDIKAVNRIHGNRIVAGKRIKIPSRGASKKQYYAKKSKKSKRVSGNNKKSQFQLLTHRVQKGDSLWNIARKYGTTTKNIVRTNHLSSTQLKIGQQLKIPMNATKNSTKQHKYRVKRGDSPFQIAMKHNMTLAQFLRINRMSPRSKIFPGQLVYVE